MLYQFLVPDREASKERVALSGIEKEVVKKKLAYLYGFKERVLSTRF